MSDSKPSIRDDYDDEKVAAIMDKLFPHDAPTFTAKLFGIPRKQTGRWHEGYNRAPPHIVAKMEAQAKLRDQFETALTGLLDEAEKAGLRRVVQRHVLLGVVNSGRFDADEEPL